ncbi:helix-turn-helix domain-containing protein [Xanthobacter flavus]|nr:helix-turn-helix domain-containing protein [Xanthobacter flavus]
MLIAMGSADAPIDGSDLPPEIATAAAAAPAATDLRTVEEAAIRAAVEACGGNLTRAARRLGIARSTLYMRLAALERDA